MTTILPSERSSWDLIGRSIGRNLESTLPRVNQRNIGLGAIDQLQNEISTAKGDLSKILPALARAYTLNPNLERSGLGQQYLTLAQRERGAQEFPVGGKTTSSGIPLKTQSRKEGQTSQEVPVSVDDLVPPRPGMIADPGSAGKFQLPYGPEDIGAIRQAARQNGYSQEMEDRFVEDAKERNQIATNQREIQLADYAQAQKEREDTLANQAAFNTYLTQNTPEFAQNPDERELALKASEKYQGEKSFANRLAKVKEELRPYQASKKALEKTLKRPFLGKTKEQRAIDRPRARMMVDMGQKPQLQLMIANGGNGEVEEADLLNPLKQDFENNFKKFNNFIKPLEAITSIEPESPEYQKQLERGIQKRDSQKNHMVDFISDNLNSGTYKDPGTNLLLTRFHIMQKGLDWQESANVIDDAIKKSGIKLDPQQKIDYVKLSYPPLTGETYSDTILNNLMFPVTGKQ